MIHENAHVVFHFVRHGESELNRQPEIIGGRSPDTQLSARGRQQCQRLGARLNSEGVEVDLFFSSPLPRAVDSSELICRTTGFSFDRVEMVPELTELSQGAWEGQDRTKVYTDRCLQYINTKGPLFTPPDGEAQRMVQRRVSNWLEDRVIFNKKLLAETPVLNVLVVSHALTLKCLFHYIMGFNDRLIYRVQIDNCSLSRFVFKREGWFPHALNDAYHLNETGRARGDYTGL